MLGHTQFPRFNDTCGYILVNMGLDVQLIYRRIARFLRI